MNKKILGIFVSLLVVTMFTVPAIAKPTEIEVTYTKKRIGPMVVEWKDAGPIFHVVKSEQSGVIYEGDQDLGDPTLASFTFTAIGKMHNNPSSLKQVWHFDYVWTSVDDPDSGFKGRLNGYAGDDSLFTVQGVLQGFGELKGQKLVVEAERQAPTSAGIAIFTGSLITN